MKLPTILVLVALVFPVLALPLQKRISQQSQASTVPFLGACFAAHGGSSCNDVANFSFGSLHAGGNACQQQEGGDRMIDLAKQLGNNTEMIRLAQLFVQQPRSSPDSLSELYCTQPPRNAELIGYYQCQFATENLSEFENESPSQLYQVGAPGTIPFGLSGPVTPPGSCPAHPDGPIPDGQQLVDLVQSPGIPAVGQGAAGSVVSSTQAQPSIPSTPNRFGLPTGVAWNKGAAVPYVTAAPVPYSARKEDSP